ncbi:MAG: hypothetical protein B6U72_01810 [Candidatus Altiarchaeales archaeon ex4484_2]|nr:MAG: hypothetical protein B6U72_01810 [Candidatus Altiarchaeales archaeon ex4484_2]
MDKAGLNYVTDALMALSLIFTAASGFILLFFLPYGIRQGRLQEFLGLSKQAWIMVHDLSGLILVILVIVHLSLHWRWAVSMTKKYFF